MKIYIDQSGKIENTAKMTIIAFSNKRTFAVKLNARTKRQLQEFFRRSGMPRLFVYRTFAALIFLLIKDFLPTIQQVVIDIEYTGHEKLIKDIILEFLRERRLKEPVISFKRIGNRPRVHYAAYDVFSGKKKEDQLITLEEIAELAIKKDRGR